MHPIDEWLLRLKRLVRVHDADTSLAAGARVFPRLSEMQQAVYNFMLNRDGPVTDEQIEEYPGFADIRRGASGPYSISTARKRRTELVAKGLVVQIGYTKNRKGNTVKTWGIKGIHDRKPQ